MSIRLLVHIVIILSITTNSNEEARLKLNNRTSSLISNTQSSASTDRDIWIRASKSTVKVEKSWLLSWISRRRRMFRSGLTNCTRDIWRNNKEKSMITVLSSSNYTRSMRNQIWVENTSSLRNAKDALVASMGRGLFVLRLVYRLFSKNLRISSGKVPDTTWSWLESWAFASYWKFSGLL